MGELVKAAHIVARRNVCHLARAIHVLGARNAVDIGAERDGEYDDIRELDVSFKT